MQAVTKVNLEKASKVAMLGPTLLPDGEGRRAMTEQPTREAIASSRGSGDGMHPRPTRQRERPAAVAGRGRQQQKEKSWKLADAGVGGAHSTWEAGQRRWREGALVLARF